MADYAKQNIIEALKSLGLKQGDSLFCHNNIGFFGRLEDAKSSKDYYEIFKSTIFEVIGDEGTLVCPTFSYTFCKQQDFDVKNTPGVCGAFSEMMREDKDAFRSEDANFSIVAIGKNAKYFTENSPEYSFGENCFWERYLKVDGIFCNFNFDSGSTFIHYVEKRLNVLYRWDKGFDGIVINGGKKEKRTFYHFVCDLENENHSPDFTKFDKKAKELGLAKTTNLGKGQILKISAKDTFNLIEKELKTTPNFLIKGSL